MTSLAHNSKPSPLRVQSKPRQLNTKTLNLVKVEVERNQDFGRINRFNCNTADDCYGDKHQSKHLKLVNNDMQNTSNTLTIEEIEIRTYVIKLLEDLESNINNENFGKTTYELIANVCNYLKENGKYLDEDSAFKEQMDVYYNLLRNILRNPKIDKFSRALILEIIELRACNWVYNEDIDSYYRKKFSELDSNEHFSPMCEMSRGLKTSQSSGSILSSIGSEIVKSSGKFMKPTKVPGKTFLKDEVVIRNSDSGKVNPGVKERLVQITGPTEENIERAKELIESTIKRNASPVPFECSTKPSFDSSFNEIHNEINENEIFESINIENMETLSSINENKMSYSFTVNIDDEVIQLSTKNYIIGQKAKQMLENLFTSPNKHMLLEERSESSNSYSNSNSDDILIAANKQTSNITKTAVNAIKRDDGFSLQRQSSATKINESFGNDSNQLQRSSSHGNVPIGRTSLRYMNTTVAEVPEYVTNDKNIITYDRDFLMKCKNSPLSQKMPTIFSEIADKLPHIIRNNDTKQSPSLSLFDSSSNQNNTYEQW